MGAKTGIEWTDATWNPLRGCSPVSAGCKNCYASRDAKRFSGPGAPFEGLVRINAIGERTGEWNGQVHFIEKHLRDPLKWGSVIEHGPDCKRSFDKGNEYCGCSRPRRIFVNSVSDLFHESVPDKWIDRIFAVMALCPQHTFQVLTKRPERMLKYFTEKHRNPQEWPDENYDVQTCIRLSIGGLIPGKVLANGRPDILRAMKNGDFNRYGDADARIYGKWPLSNVWLGVSVENQAAADERIPLLLQTPAAARFISAEPLLGSLDVAWALSNNRLDIGAGFLLRGRFAPGMETLRPLDWAICGGESGPCARPIHPDWARSLRDQCAAANVPFFFKQWGEWAEVDGGPPNRVFDVDRAHAPIDASNCVISLNGHRPSCQAAMNEGELYRWMSRVGKKAAGSLLDGLEHKAFPEARG